jgi:hypothetical protein
LIFNFIFQSELIVLYFSIWFSLFWFEFIFLVPFVKVIILFNLTLQSKIYFYFYVNFNSHSFDFLESFY